MSNVLQRVGQSLFGLNRARRPQKRSAASIERAAQRAIESLETRVMLTINTLTDPFTGGAVDTSKWTITTRGLEHNGPAGYNDPTEDASGLTLGGTTTASYWYGSSLESSDTFDSGAKTTVQVDRVSLNGSGSAYRSSLWLLQDGGQYLHFSQNIGETGWSYNNTTTGGGNSIGSFNAAANDGGDHIMKLVYTPSGGTAADVDIYLDGNLGTTVHFSNWNNTVPFHVIVTGQGRAAGDSVAAVFKDFSAVADPIPTNPPSAPTNLTATAAAHGLNVALSWLDTANNEINYRVERSKDNVNFTEIATLPAASGSGTTVTYTDAAPGAGTKFYYRVRGYNNANGGAYSDYSASANATTAAAITSLADPLTGSSVDLTKWDITQRGLENVGPAGYNDPVEDSTGLTLSGTATGQYWFGSSLESKDLFNSTSKTTVTVDRVSLTGSGSAYRSSLWLYQPVAGGQFLHFAQDVNETQWEYNQTAGNIGTPIPTFNNVTTDGGEHTMKLVYTPLGGTNASVDMYLDGVLGATANFTNWDNTVPFKVILTGQGRAIGDSVSAEFKDFNVTSEALATSAPAAPTNLTVGTGSNGVGAQLSWLDNASNEASYQVERSIDGVTYKLIGTLPAVDGTGNTLTFNDPAPIGGQTMHYRVRAFNTFAGGTFSAYATNDYAVPAFLTDSLTGSSVDLTKWDITNRGLENNGPAGYNDPSESATGLTLGGTTNAQYWFGSSLESKQLFFSQAPAVVTVDRVSLTGSGTAYRSSLWLLQPNGQFLHFSQNIGETGWQYNQTGGGSGTGIAAFNSAANDQGEHRMQLVYTPLGGMNADVAVYLDGVLGTTVHFTNWDNTVPFKVILTGQGRAAGDTVSAVFKDFSVSVPASVAPAAPTNVSITADTAVHLQFTDNSPSELTFAIERSIDGTNFSNVGFVGAADGTGTVLTFDDRSAQSGVPYFYRVRAVNYANATGNAGSSRILSATANVTVATSLTDPLTGDSVDTTKWDITQRGLENTGPAGYSDPFESAAGLDLGGTATAQYWYGSSIESKALFSSSVSTTVQVERVFLLGSGSGIRSSLWLLQPGGQFLHFAQDIGEDNWQYNQTSGGGGTPIDAFNNVTTDGGDHIMKVVYTPLGGSDAQFDLYLDDTLGATATFNNWDNSVPFKVILTGQGRAIGDLVGARFANLSVTTGAVTPPLTVSGTGGADTFYIRQNPDGINDDVWINSATPGQGAPDQQIPIGQAGGVLLDALGGDDKLILDYTNGSPIPTSGLKFAGGGGTDTMQVVGAGPTDAIGLFGTKLNHAGGGLLDTGGDVEKLIIHNANVATPSLTIGAGGFTGGVDIGVGGTLRVIYADLNASPASTIRGYLTTGRNGGTWNGPGISSSDVATHSGTAVGYADDGQTVKIMYTLSGDVDLDGSVGFPDLVAVAQHYGASGGNLTWSTGDVTYDNQVEFADLVAVAQNYGKTAPTAAAVPAAPVAAAPVVAASQAAPTRTETVPTAPVVDGSTTATGSVVTPVITPKPVTMSKPTPVVVAPVTIAKPTPTAKPVISDTATITPGKVQSVSSSVVTSSNVAAAALVVTTSPTARSTTGTTKPTSVFALQSSLSTVGRAEALRGNVVTRKKSNTLFN